MAYSPSEKYPGAVDVDPDYQGGKFRDNNPSTTNNGSPLKAIDRNELLARDEAIMNDAGFEYSGVADTPQDSQLFKAYKASLGNGANLLSNHNFLIQTPDDSQPLPSATPTSYPPGYQIFSGVFANETTGITNLTYIDGRVSFSGGDLYFPVSNTGAIARLTSDQLTASVADFDGKPRTRGVSFALVGDEYRVTVGIDALEDASAVLTPLGSVKFEQGSVATGHEVGLWPPRVTQNLTTLKSTVWPEYTRVKTDYHTNTGIGSAEYLITPISDYPGTPDGSGDVFVNSNTAVAVLQGNIIDITQMGAIPDGSITYASDGAISTVNGTDNTTVLSAISLLAENRDAGQHFTINRTFKGTLKVNRSNVKITGFGTVTTDAISPFVCLETEAPDGAINFGPFGGEPWNYPAQIAPGVTLHRVTSNINQGDLNITIDTTSGLTVGMTGVLISGKNIVSTPAINHVPQKFQFVKIMAINPNTLTLSEEVYVDMDVTALDTYFVQWEMLENIHIEGPTFYNKNGAIYAHRLGGMWNGYINTPVMAETANGALACCKTVTYGVDALRGQNGISTARMSEDITIDSVVKVGRVPSIGTSESIACFHEENPRRIHFKSLNAQNGALVVGGSSEHTSITGEVDVDGLTRRALFLSGINEGASIQLNGKLKSSSADYTARSQSVSSGDIQFEGQIYNSGGGDAWQHDTGSSNTLPVLRVRADAPFETANYINSFRTDLDRDKRLTKNDATPSGAANVTVVGTTPTKQYSVGNIGNILYGSTTGKYTVQIVGESFASGTEYGVHATGIGAKSEVFIQNATQCELMFTDGTGNPVNPTGFTVTIYSA